MGKNIQHNLKRMAATFLLYSFAAFWISTHFFVHVHLVGDQWVVHSHPFSQNEAHQHSDQQIVLIHFMQHFEGSTSNVRLSFAAIESSVSQLFWNNHTQNFNTSQHRTCALRAPPFFAF